MCQDYFNHADPKIVARGRAMLAEMVALGAEIVPVCVRVFVREREGGKGTERERPRVCVCVGVGVGVWVRE